MPVKRSRLTKNYTQIDNRILRDRQLTPEERFLLAWLLSHDEHWRIIIPVIQRETGWGRDKVYRVLKRLCEFEYIYRSQERDPNTGAFGEVVYFVYADRDLNPFSTQGIKPRLPDSPHPGNSKAFKERNTKTERTPPTPSRDPVLQSQTPPLILGKRIAISLDHLWAAYGPDLHMSRKATERVWRRMNPVDQEHALEAVPIYLADCRSNNRKRVNIDRFLRDRIWQGFADRSNSSTHIAIWPRSPQWDAWREYFVRIGSSTILMDQRYADGKPFTVRNEWPPQKGEGGPKL